MLWEEPNESAEYLLATALGHGYRVSQSELYRWQQWGLVGAPRQRGLGRGRGSVVRYDPGSALRLVAVFRQLWWDRSRTIALFRLWFEGYPIEEELLRDFLHERIERLAYYRDKFETADFKEPGDPDDVLDQLGKRARGRLHHRVLGRLRRALGKERFSILLHLMTWVVLGLFDGWADPDDPDIIGDSFGIDPKLAKRELIAISQLFGPENLRRALDCASLQELKRARDELRAVLDYWRFYLIPERIWAVEKMLGEHASQLLALTLNDPAFNRHVLPYLFIAALAAQMQGPEVFDRLIGNRQNPWTIPDPWPVF